MSDMATSFEFSGGALCLDFVNTLGDRPRCTHETLREFDDLLRWAAEAGIVRPVERRDLRRRARARPDEARRELRRALDLRETLYRIFAARAAGHRPGAPDLARLNESLRAALSHLEVKADGREIRWDWSEAAERPDRLLWPVTRSAADLLTSLDVALVKECDSGTCSWMFLDRSRNRRRRWCDMKTCGNRAKARRHYRRSRKRSGAEAARNRPV